MFKSKKSAQSHAEKDSTFFNLNESCPLVPKNTSTPVNSHVVPSSRSATRLSPAVAKQGTPRRYSLSEIAAPSTSRRNQHCQGPLLTPLNYKDNVSLYEETKSFGLAKRIVLYNEEAEEERRLTHQERYNSPGLFPVVHLFKKQPHALDQSLRRVKVKLSSPGKWLDEETDQKIPEMLEEYLRLCPPEEKRKLLSEMTKPARQRQISLPSRSPVNDIGAKSVLDALKEISRKRIHSGEEPEFSEESGKRIRTELQNGSVITSSKRVRADSPLLDSSTSPTLRQTKKRFCVYDEFTASKSSSDLSSFRKSEPVGIKRKTTSTSTESLVEPKQVKLVNAETQTITPVSETIPEPVAPVSVQIDSKTKNKNSIKVFDDAPLDRIRKSRLAALMGNLSGKDVALPLEGIDELEKNGKTTEPQTLEAHSNKAENESAAVVATAQETPKAPLVSSLTTPTSEHSLQVKSNKHVHFELPSATNSQPEPASEPTNDAPLAVSDAVKSATSKASFSVNFGDLSSTAGKSSVAFTSPVSSKAQLKVPGDTLNGSTSLVLPFNKPPSTSIASEKFSDANVSSNSSPPKPGGFKFDLQTHPVTKSVALSPSNLGVPSAGGFNFGNSENKQSLSSLGNGSQSLLGLASATTKSFNSTPALTTTSASSFSFGSSANDLKFVSNTQASSVPTTRIPITSSPGLPSSGFSTGAFGTPKSTPSADHNPVKSVPSISFGSAGAPATNKSIFGTSQSTGFGATNTSSTSSSVNFAFGGNQTTNLFQNAASDVALGSSTSSAFGNTPAFAATTTATSSSFVAPSTTVTSSSFGAPSTATTSTFFGAPSTTASSSFGAPSTTVTSSSFGAPSTATTSSFFGAPSTTASSSFSVPSTIAAPSSFAVPVASAAGFGSSGFKLPAFGTSQSAFGPTADTSAVPSFGTVSTTAASSAFNSSNVFGKTTQAPTFGSGTNSAFGVPAQSSSVFGASSAKPTNPPPPYGSSVFSTPTTTSAPTFKANPAPSFSFGSNKAANPFGGPTTGATFGTPTSFTSSSGFGSGAPAFGSTTSASSTFGTTSVPGFGQTDNQPKFTFGGTEAKADTAFGSGSANAFGKPTNAPGSGFGATASNVFGSSNPSSAVSTQQTNGGFNFGSNASATSTPFAFGSSTGSNQPSKPSFSFTGQSPAAFGSVSAPAPTFGATLSTNFAATGAAPQPSGVFNIGTGSAAKPRAQLRAKRRT